MYSEVDDMFPDTDSYLLPPTYLGGCRVGDEDNKILEEIALMGYDIEDEEFLMSGPFKRLFKKIQKRIRKRREARAKKQAMREMKSGKEEQPEFSLQTRKGVYGIGPQGPSYMPRGQMPVSPQQPATTAGIMEMFQKNPMMLAIPIGLLAIMLLKN